MNDASSCVLLADSHHSVIEGLRGLLETAFSSVFMVGDLRSLEDGVRRLRPEVVVVDLSLAGGQWRTLLERMRDRSPRTKLVVVSVYDDASVVRAAIGAGAHGFVLKRALAQDMLDATHAVLGGATYISPGARREGFHVPTSP
jgi:two-component system response regulator NreC